MCRIGMNHSYFAIIVQFSRQFIGMGKQLPLIFREALKSVLKTFIRIIATMDLTNENLLDSISICSCNDAVDLDKRTYAFL
jgi:hypothetical protein